MPSPVAPGATTFTAGTASGQYCSSISGLLAKPLVASTVLPAKMAISSEPFLPQAPTTASLSSSSTSPCISQESSVSMALSASVLAMSASVRPAPAPSVVCMR